MTRRINFFLLAMITVCSWFNAPQAAAQTPTSTVKEIRYDYLQLKGPLPYQESFKLKGNRNVFLGIADAATLTIHKDGEDDHRYFWWTKGTKNATEEQDFEFYIDQGLKFGTDYDLQFEFYQLSGNSTELKTKLKLKLLPVLEEAYKTAGLATDVLKTKLSTVLTDVITESTGEQRPLGKLVIDKGQVTFAPIATPKMNDVDIAAIMTLVILKGGLIDKQDFLEKKKGEIRAISVTGLRMWMTSYNQPAATKYFTPGDIAEVENFLKNYSLLSSGLLDKIELLTIPQAPVPPRVLDMKALPDLMIAYMDTQSSITLMTNEIAPLTRQYETTVDELILDKVYTGVGSGITVAAKTENDIKSTEIVGTRFTAVVGAGAAALNLHAFGHHGPVEYQPISYLAVKYYLTKVDKRVPEPYLEPGKLFSKWSFVVGWKVSGDMTFQARSLSNVIGIYPVTGLSYDFSRYISVDFLGIFYKHQSINLFEANPKLGLAPLVTLSADFDLINRLKSLFTSTPYSTTKPKTP